MAAPRDADARHEDDASGGREVAQSDQRYLSGHISVAISWAHRPAAAPGGRQLSSMRDGAGAGPTLA